MFIDDKKIEATSELVHVPIRAFEGRHGDRRHAAYTIAVTPDQAPVHRADLLGPLLEQDTGWHKAQRAQLRPLHGGKGQPRLAASSRKRHDTSSMGQFPRRQRRLLVGAEIDVRPRRLRISRTIRDVLESNAGREEPALQGRVLACGCTIRAHAMIPEDSRCRGEVHAVRCVGQQDGPSVESQLHAQ